MDDIVRQKATKCRKSLLNLRKAIEKQVASGSDNDYSKLKSYVGGILDVIENGMPEAELKSRCEKLGSYVSDFTNLEILQNAEEFASNAQKVKKADFSDFLTEFSEGQTADDQRFWAEAYAEESEKSNPIPEEPEPTVDEPQYDMEEFWNRSQSQPSGQTQSSSQNKSSGQSQSTEKKKDGNGCCGCITFLIIGLLIYGAYKMWPDIKAWFGSSNDVNPETAAYVIAESLNLRGGPEKSAGNIMDRLLYGTPVQPEDGDYGEWERVKAKDMSGYVSSTGIVDYESFHLLENVWGDEATRKLVVELRHRMALIKFCRAYDSSGDFKLYAQDNRGNNMWSSKTTGGNGAFAFILDNKVTGSRVAAVYSFDKDNTPFCEHSEEISGAGTYIKKVTVNKKGVYKITYGSYSPTETQTAPTALNSNHSERNTGKPDEYNSNSQQASSLESSEIYESLDQKASFPGGIRELNTYLSSHIKYPVDAEENGIQGRVVAAFVVERDGSISDITIVNSVYPSLDKEAVRVIQNMPKWNPGKIGGSPVRSRFSLPITFRLQ